MYLNYSKIQDQITCSAENNGMIKISEEHFNGSDNMFKHIV